MSVVRTPARPRRMPLRLLTVAVLAVAALLAGQARALADPAMPGIRHVFVIVLENESDQVAFGSGSAAPYLADTLTSEGAYLPDYYAIGHHSNDNYIAMVSGQAPNLDNMLDCQVFGNFPAADATGFDGQQRGFGCVYPSAIANIGTQLDAAGLTWRDYDEDMGNVPSRDGTTNGTCGHPAIGAADPTQKATATDQYAARHNPFVYFHSVIDDQALCDQDVVNLDQLPTDLASESTTPNYSFIVPNLCDDGHDAPCASGQPGGLTSANAFLEKWVPMITQSPAFAEQNGLLIVTFDESDSTDVSSCCGELPGPGFLLPGLFGFGGGDVGAVMLSPCIAPGTVSTTSYDHYSMLRSVEDIFGVSHLGYAQLSGSKPFGSDVFTRSCGPPAG